MCVCVCVCVCVRVRACVCMYDYTGWPKKNATILIRNFNDVID